MVETSNWRIFALSHYGADLLLGAPCVKLVLPGPALGTELDSQRLPIIVMLCKFRFALRNIVMWAASVLR